MRTYCTWPRLFSAVLWKCFFFFTRLNQSVEYFIFLYHDVFQMHRQSRHFFRMRKFPHSARSVIQMKFSRAAGISLVQVQRTSRFPAERKLQFYSFLGCASFHKLFSLFFSLCYIQITQQPLFSRPLTLKFIKRF